MSGFLTYAYLPSILVPFTSMTSYSNTRDERWRLPPRRTLHPEERDERLQIGIIGAGIGGLMAAIALLESGHDVEVSL